MRWLLDELEHDVPPPEESKPGELIVHERRGRQQGSWRHSRTDMITAVALPRTGHEHSDSV
jgi:hypothetical protein